MSPQKSKYSCFNCENANVSAAGWKHLKWRPITADAGAPFEPQPHWVSMVGLAITPFHLFVVRGARTGYC